MRAFLALIAILAASAVSVLWIGTTHRDRCMRAGDVGCTIVPWSGHALPKPKPATKSIWGFSMPSSGGS